MRQTEPRNTPTIINAALFERLFWDVRANNEFNGVDGFGPALAWLRDHAPNGATTPVVCHGDLQPLNVMAENGELTGAVAVHSRA